MDVSNSRFGGLTSDRKRSKPSKTVSVTCFECKRNKDAHEHSPRLESKLEGAE